MSWRDQFPADYDVPDCITQAEGLIDKTWGNDVCPSFGVPLPNPDHHLTIWVEHPDPDRREYDGPRFSITFLNLGDIIPGHANARGSELREVLSYEEPWASDDENEVIPTYVNLLRQYRNL